MNNEPSLCIGRRSHPEVTTLAHFQHPAYLITKLKKEQRQNTAAGHRLRSLWGSTRTTVNSVRYEALTAFEYGDMATSAGEWHLLIQSLGIGGFETVAKVATALNKTSFADSRSRPGSQAESIYNWDEIRGAMMTTGDESLVNMLRTQKPTQPSNGSGAINRPPRF